MAQRVHFLQECPTCGRSLQVKVEYLGRLVTCQHCHGSFVASDPSLAVARPTESALLRRANELLDLVESRREGMSYS